VRSAKPLSNLQSRKEGEITTVSSSLKLVTRYDAGRNEFTILRHNLTPDAADAAVRDFAARLCGLFIIDQQAAHSVGDPKSCEACYTDVQRTSHVKPKPVRKGGAHDANT